MVLANLPYSVAERMARQIEGIDMILGGDGAFATLERPDFVNGTLVLYGGDQGQYVGRVEAYPAGDVVDKLVCKVVALDTSLADDPAMASFLEGYRTAAPKPQKPKLDVIQFETASPQTQHR